MKKIALTQGKEVIVDSSLFDELNLYKWCYANTGYAKRREKGTGKTILMHRQILGAITGKEVDHINGNRLDCRTTNLRIATRSENCSNRLVKGFETVRHAKGYAVRLSINGIRYYLGRFKTISEARNARNDKLKELGINHGNRFNRG